MSFIKDILMGVAWLMLTFVLILNTACATTSYEKCQKGNEWTRYGSMDQCVSIKEEDRKERREYWNNFSFTKDVPKAQPIQYYQPKNCSSFVSGNQVYTSCN